MFPIFDPNQFTSLNDAIEVLERLTDEYLAEQERHISRWHNEQLQWARRVFELLKKESNNQDGRADSS